jgi:glycosyltransferase involved in cell wall biosynthesis
LTPLEALRQNTPVVVSDIPAHRETCGAAATYFPTGSREGMSMALDRVLERSSPPAHAPILARRWSDNANELARVLISAAQEGPGRSST